MNIKKISAILGFMIILVGCVQPESKDKLVIGFTDYPPMGFKDTSGNVVGFDIDFAKEVMNSLDLDYEFQYINWDSKVLELDSKQIDLIWNGFTVTPEREKEVLFSKPYIENTIVMIVRADDTSISNFEDLDGKFVAVESESSGQHALESLTPLKSYTLNRFTSISEALLDLKAGNSDVVVADGIYGRYITSHDESVKVIEGQSLKSEDYAVGMRLEDLELKEKLDEAIDLVIESGKASEISIKWFGTDIIKP